MMADKLLNAQDLITAKKLDTFRSEVITGKAGGLSTGANIDYATNAVTGQVQKTLPKILDDLDWSYVGLFADGVTFTKKTDFALDSVGTQWIYTGSLPFTATSGTVPSEPTYQVVHVKSASAISNENGGSVQDFIDETEIDILLANSKDVKSCAEWADLLNHGTNPAIACMGDSTMWGATIGNLGAQDSNNPPASLKKALSLLYPNYTLTPINLAISGSTLDGMINGTDGSGSTFEQKLMAGGSLGTADIIYCNHGINDSQLDLGVELYRENLYKFIYLCREYNSNPVLVTPNPNPILLIIDETKSKRLMNYVNMMRDVAEQTNCDLVDNFHYFSKTANQISINVIVPDGAHLSSQAYRQAGFNLAIPLLSVQHLSKTGDVVGLTQTTWFDNANVSRKIQNWPTIDGTRCGTTLSFNREMGRLVGLNYPVVLDEPLKCVSMIGLQWPSGSKMNVTVNEYGIFYPFSSEKVYGDLSYLNWDAENKIRHQMWAGLNIFNFVFDIDDPSAYDGFAFSGLYVPQTKFTSMNQLNGSAVKQPAIGNYDSVTAMVKYSDTDAITLADRSGSPCLAITKDSGILTVKLYSNGAVIYSQAILPTIVIDGVYPTQIIIEPTHILCSVSAIALTVAISTPMPELQVQTPWLTYNVEPSQSF